MRIFGREHPVFRKAHEVKTRLWTEGYALSSRNGPFRVQLREYQTEYGHSAYLKLCF